MANLLYSHSVPVSEKISIVVPTVRQILENENTYNDALSLIVSTPYDQMVLLDDLKIDFTTINDYELFLLFFIKLQEMDYSMVFDANALDGCKIDITPQTKQPVIMDKVGNVVIDRNIFYQLCATLRKINYLERNNKTPGNEAARQFMLERARKKLHRAANKNKESDLERLIISMVNTEQFKYGYEGVLDLTIYQFKSSVYQIIKKINFDNTMIGCYAGTINMKDLSQDDLSWLAK